MRKTVIVFIVTMLVSVANAAGYVRPYGPNAPWNRRVDVLPVHSESERYAELLWNYAADRPGNFNLNFGYDGYTYPVYYAADATGEYRVKDLNHWGNLDGKKIPFNFNWVAAVGTDAQIIILDPPTGREWNLWQVVNRGNNVIQISNGNLIQKGLQSGDGSNPANYFWKENGFMGSRGVGIQYFAMLVTEEEIRQGVIEHALSMPIRNTSRCEYVAPATKLEHSDPGSESCLIQIPEGMRFALDVTDEEIKSWVNGISGIGIQTKRTARIIAKALRDYGWFITDTSGGAHLQFEDYHTADWGRYGISPDSGNLLDGLMTKDNIYAIVPSDQYPRCHRGRKCQ